MSNMPIPASLGGAEREHHLVPIEYMPGREYRFVGADALAEISLISSQIEMIDRGEEPALVVDNIYGPAGIGKTAFLMELAKHCLAEQRGYAYIDLSKYQWEDLRPERITSFLLDRTTGTQALLPRDGKTDNLPAVTLFPKANDDGDSQAADGVPNIALTTVTKPTFVLLIDGTEVLLREHPGLSYHQLIHLLQTQLIVPLVEGHKTFVVMAGKSEVVTSFIRDETKRRTRLHKLQSLSAEETMSQLGISDITVATRLIDFTGGNPLANVVAIEAVKDEIKDNADLLTMDILARQHERIIERLAQMIQERFLSPLPENIRKAFIACILRDFTGGMLLDLLRIVPEFADVSNNELLGIEGDMYESGLLEYGNPDRRIFHRIDSPFRLMVLNYLELKERENLLVWYQRAHQYCDQVIQDNKDIDFLTLSSLSPDQVNYYVLSTLYYRAQALRFEALERGQTGEEIMRELLHGYLDLRFRRGKQVRSMEKMIQSDPDLNTFGYSKVLIDTLNKWNHHRE